MKAYIGGHSIRFEDSESKILNGTDDLDRLIGTSTSGFDYYNIFKDNGLPKNCPIEFGDLLIKKYNKDSDLQILLCSDGCYFRYNNHQKHRDFRKVF